MAPFELQRQLNGECFLNFLQNNFNGLVEGVSLETHKNMRLQHEGPPPHSARVVRDYIISSSSQIAGLEGVEPSTGHRDPLTLNHWSSEFTCVRITRKIN